jgi:hypothetical protein
MAVAGMGIGLGRTFGDRWCDWLLSARGHARYAEKENWADWVEKCEAERWTVSQLREEQCRYRPLRCEPRIVLIPCSGPQGRERSD